MGTGDLSQKHFSDEFPRVMGRPANAALVDKGITTLKQVATYSEKELLAIHGVGPKAIAILKTELAKHHLQLRGE